MKEDMRGAVYASGEMRAVVVRRPAAIEVVLTDDVGSPRCNEGAIVTDSVLLAYLICTSDCTCRVIMTTEEDLRDKGYERLYAFGDRSGAVFEACEAHS